MGNRMENHMENAMETGSIQRLYVVFIFLTRTSVLAQIMLTSMSEHIQLAPPLLRSSRHPIVSEAKELRSARAHKALANRTTMGY